MTTESFFAFAAYNEQTIYGYGAQVEADAYVDHLNGEREINLRCVKPLTDDEAREMGLYRDDADVVNLGDELLAIGDDAADAPRGWAVAG